jgi:hypothetical protein
MGLPQAVENDVWRRQKRYPVDSTQWEKKLFNTSSSKTTTKMTVGPTSIQKNVSDSFDDRA